MKVYIDLVMIVNFIFDFILLISVNYILRRNVKVIRLILSSLVGTITLLILFIHMSNIMLLSFKFLVSVVMVMVAFGIKDIKYILKNILYFYLVSMLLGGGIEFLNNQFSYSNEGLVFTNNGLGISYGIILIVGLFMYFKYVRAFKDLKNHYSNYYKCIIYFSDENLVEVNAFLDTGNKLVDPYSNKSIILLHEDMLDRKDELKPLYVPYSSLNNHGLLTCYQALKIEIDGKSYDKFLVGVSHENFFIDGINCIINNQVMEGLR